MLELLPSGVHHCVQRIFFDQLSSDMDRQEMASALFQYVSTPKWRRLVTAEDQFYSEAIALVDDALLR